VISIVFCCHSVKLCALAAQALQSQQSGAVSDQDVNVVPGASFIKKDRCGSLQKGGDVVALSQLALC